jgi:hypothetical protein
MREPNEVPRGPLKIYIWVGGAMFISHCVSLVDLFRIAKNHLSQSEHLHPSRIFIEVSFLIFYAVAALLLALGLTQKIPLPGILNLAMALAVVYPLKLIFVTIQQPGAFKNWDVAIGCFQCIVAASTVAYVLLW